MVVDDDVDALDLSSLLCLDEADDEANLPGTQLLPPPLPPPLPLPLPLLPLLFLDFHSFIMSPTK